MLIIKNTKIKDIKYNSLILYALLRCDMFSFRVSDFYTKTSSSERSPEFLEYKKRINFRLEAFQPYVVKKYVSNEHCGSLYSYYSEIYILSLNEDVSSEIFATDGLFSWIYPDMPEDLCLYSKGKCWMKSVAHERICWIYTDNEVEKDIIKKVIGLRFLETDNSDAPTLDLKK